MTGKRVNVRGLVLVHVHDIFTPWDYLEQWPLEGVKFWNEQYLLEAFVRLCLPLEF